MHYQGKDISAKQLVSVDFQTDKEGHFAVLSFDGEKRKRRTPSFKKAEDLQKYVGSLDYKELKKMPKEDK